jgi:IclR family acetate operon transcriptional repressor
MAARDDEAIERFIDGVNVQPEPLRLHDPDDFRQRLQVARERGFSLDDEDDSIGVRCIGVAVRGPDADPLFAISITGPSPRFTREAALRYGPELAVAGERLSRQFGYSPVSDRTDVA